MVINVNKMIKFIINTIIDKTYETKLGTFFINKLCSNFMSQTTIVVHDNLSLEFATPNPTSKWRAKTFSFKEPETLQWIDEMKEDSCFWDVGANIGLYTIYAAKTKKIKVYAFEPSVFNLELLSRNINLNKVEDKIRIVTMAISDKNGFSMLSHTTKEWGGALSVFGEEFGSDGNRVKTKFKYLALGMKADDFLKLEGFIQPDYIKIDVDGIEHLILSKACEILLNVKSVLVEINEDFTEQLVKSDKILKKAGLNLKSKNRTSPLTSKTPNVFNQIWIR